MYIMCIYIYNGIVNRILTLSSRLGNPQTWMAEGTWWFRPPWNKGTRGRVAMIGTSRCHGIWQFGDFARHQNSLIDDRCGDCTSVFNTSQENGSRTTYTIRVISAWSCIYLQYILVHAIHSCPSYRISWIPMNSPMIFPSLGVSEAHALSPSPSPCSRISAISAPASCEHRDPHDFTKGMDQTIDICCACHRLDQWSRR